jgi:hypothetical protein
MTRISAAVTRTLTIPLIFTFILLICVVLPDVLDQVTKALCRFGTWARPQRHCRLSSIFGPGPFPGQTIKTDSRLAVSVLRSVSLGPFAQIVHVCCLKWLTCRWISSPTSIVSPVSICPVGVTISIRQFVGSSRSASLMARIDCGRGRQRPMRWLGPVFLGCLAAGSPIWGSGSCEQVPIG